MKLNFDCVRDVLLAIESKEYGIVSTIEELEITKHSDEDVRYCVEKLVQAGYIVGNDYSSLGKYECLIRSLSFEGHAFLDNIRPQDVWDQTKSIINNVGSTSLEVVSSIAAQVIANIITAKI